jgi:hypothetical protein
MSKEREVVKKLSQLIARVETAEKLPMPDEETFRSRIVLGYGVTGSALGPVHVALQEWLATAGSDLIWNGFRQWLDSRKVELSHEIAVTKDELQTEWKALEAEAVVEDVNPV